MSVATLEAWSFVQKVVADLTSQITETAQTELELLEGLRALSRIQALTTEVCLDVDPESPWLFSMNSPARYVGGPNPDGEYYLAMIDGTRGYRLSGTRGTVTYLGLQVLAGAGMVPRRQAAYVSDTELRLSDTGEFSLILSAVKPEDPTEHWVEIPTDASALIVRQYVGDRSTEVLASLTIQPLEAPGSLAPLTDDVLAAQLTAMAWTILKLATLHQTIKPELLDLPNTLVTAEATALGSADTTPDNLYMIGTFRLNPEQALILDFEPPASRYWSVTLENIWHECIDVRRRPSSITSSHALVVDGRVRLTVSATDPGTGNWLDTGGRHRGFVIVRWLDGAASPSLTTKVVEL
jgi:hypothetical protein